MILQQRDEKVLEVEENQQPTVFVQLLQFPTIGSSLDNNIVLYWYM